MCCNVWNVEFCQENWMSSEAHTWAVKSFDEQKTMKYRLFFALPLTLKPSHGKWNRLDTVDLDRYLADDADAADVFAHLPLKIFRIVN